MRTQSLSGVVLFLLVAMLSYAELPPTLTSVEVGDFGPGGGVIFAVPGQKTSLEVWLQAAPEDWYAGGDPLAALKDARQLADTYAVEATEPALVGNRLSPAGGWRLPTIEELQLLFEARGQIPGLVMPSFYWSSSTAGDGSEILDMFSGYRERGRPDGRHRVRPVRTLIVE
ncbi:DUF1566 domain-containing protein [Spirochaeta africana]|uniref:DUF1566 domain-containing protein n=1 Tax=Spirochaeta africana (strain ATCC 700263 / DSM 8902 / Z-7692) TaxID=889378 RepID=H9UFS3_SPIAZ|nr:DUF1566 domain-containing protein [Spirochaeta africana]AFG36366.1 hypothetical protein Spiaf_0258 [Spirochaeta africana DSM 8902]